MSDKVNLFHEHLGWNKNVREFQVPQEDSCMFPQWELIATWISQLLRSINVCLSAPPPSIPLAPPQAYHFRPNLPLFHFPPNPPPSDQLPEYSVLCIIGMGRKRRKASPPPPHLQYIHFCFACAGSNHRWIPWRKKPLPPKNDQRTEMIRADCRSCSWQFTPPVPNLMRVRSFMATWAIRYHSTRDATQLHFSPTSHCGGITTLHLGFPGLMLMLSGPMREQVIVLSTVYQDSATVLNFGPSAQRITPCGLMGPSP